MRLAVIFCLVAVMQLGSVKRTPVAKGVWPRSEPSVTSPQSQRRLLPPKSKPVKKAPKATEVYLLRDVCIEHDSPRNETKKGSSCPGQPDLTFEIDRKIVVYNAMKTSFVKNLEVSGSNNRANLWDVHYQSSSPPSTHIFASFPVVFATTTCEANLHHFIRDEFMRIFGTMRDKGFLRRENGSLLLYRDDVHRFCRDTGCHDPTRFEPFLRTLGIRDHGAFFKLALPPPHTGICFPEAVLGTHPLGSGIPDAIAHIKQWLPPADLPGACTADREVTILQRITSRRLVNAVELRDAAQALGLSSRVVALENMSLAEQLTIANCSAALVAVMGAGQQWVSFMRPGSALLSVGWDNWPVGYYEQFADAARVRFVPLRTKGSVTPNWTQPMVTKLRTKAKNHTLSKGERILVAKHSDVSLPVPQLTAALCKLFSTQVQPGACG